MEEKTIDRIIKYLKINEKGAVVKMVASFGVSKQVIHRKLNDLIRKGLILKHGAPPKVFYTINTAKDRTLLISDIKKKITPILKKYEIKRASIFGSVARGQQNKTSDVDILVEPGKPMGFEFIGLKMDIEKSIRRKIDLLTYKSVNPLLKKEILGHQVKIYDKRSKKTV
jgi:predicted nucleotidyltransferase